MGLSGKLAKLRGSVFSKKILSQKCKVESSGGKLIPISDLHMHVCV